MGEDIQYVNVKTADAIIASVISQSSGKPNIASGDVLRKTIKQALIYAIDSLEGNLLQRQAQEQTLKRLSIDYLIDEIATVIEAREIKTLEAYQATPRSGRAISPGLTQLSQAMARLHRAARQTIKRQT